MIKYAYALLILSLISFGVYYTKFVEEAGFNQCKAGYESQLRADLNLQITINDEINAKNRRLVTELINKQNKTRVIYKTIEKKVQVYVKDNAACNLNYATYWLLNSAAQAEWMSEIDDTSITDDKKREITSVTQSNTISTCIDWAEIYNDLSKRHDALIDALSTNE